MAPKRGQKRDPKIRKTRKARKAFNVKKKKKVELLSDDINDILVKLGKFIIE